MGNLLLVAEIAGAITATVAAIAVIWSVIKWAKRITTGALCQLRSDMLRTYYRHHEEKKIRQYEYENFVMQYEAYKALGGNSFIEKIHDEVKDWDVLS